MVDERALQVAGLLTLCVCRCTGRAMVVVLGNVLDALPLLVTLHVSVQVQRGGMLDMPCNILAPPPTSKPAAIPVCLQVQAVLEMPWNVPDAPCLLLSLYVVRCRRGCA